MYSLQAWLLAFSFVSAQAGQPDSDSTKQALLDEAANYYEQQRYTASISLFERLLAMQEQTEPPQDLRIGATLNRLGAAYYRAGRNTEAIRCLKRALSISELHPTEGPQPLASSLYYLASAYANQGDVAQSEPLYLRLLATLRTWLPSADPRYATVLTEYARLLRSAKRKAEALELERQSQSVAQLK